MTYTVSTHDAWGVVRVGDFQALDEAREVFNALCADPWYQADGTVRGVELVQSAEDGGAQRLDWFAFRADAGPSSTSARP